MCAETNNPQSNSFVSKRAFLSSNIGQLLDLIIQQMITLVDSRVDKLKTVMENP